MILIQYLHFFCLILYAYMAGYILYKDPKSLLNKTCAILIASFSIWNFVDAFLSSAAITEDTAMLFQNISSIGWIGFASAVLCFSLAFSKKEKLLRNKWFMVLIFILPIFFIYKQWTNYIIIDPVRQAYGWSFTSSDTIWTHLFYVYYISFSLLAIYLIYRYGKKSEKLREKKQAKIIVASISISLIGGTIFDVVMPELNIYSIPPLANVFILFFAAGLVYTIVKYKFLTITPAVAAENIISAMDELLILLNQEGNILTVNKATLDSLQYKQKELEGKSITMLFQEDNLKKIVLEKITKEEVIKSNDSSFLTKNGKIIPIIYSSSPLKDEEGIVIGTVFIASDITKHKLAEEALHESEALYRLLADHMTDTVWLMDMNLQTTYISPSVEMSRGFTLEEIQQLPLDQNLTPASFQLAMEVFSVEMPKAISDPNYFFSRALELEFFRKNGTTFWLENLFSFIRDKNGNPVSILGVGRDITDRKQAEEALQESELRFKQVSENAHEWIWEIDKNGIYTYASPIIKEILGYEPEEIVGKKHFYDLFDEKEREKLKQSAFEIFARKESFKDLINLNIHKDGGEVFLSTSAVPILDSQGNLMGYRGLDIDITERKQAEAEIALLAHAVKSIMECISITDLDNNILFVNQSFLDTYGYREDELIGQHISMVGSPNNPPGIIEDILAATLHGGWKGELLNRKKDGSEFSVSLSTCRVYNQYGKPISLIGVAADITERKRSEVKILKTQILLQASIESPKDMIILSIDKNYQYLYFNSVHKNAMRIAYRKDVKIGMNLLDCITNDDDRIKTKGNYDRALNGFSHITVEEYGDFERYYYETRYNPIFDDKNEIIGATAFSADITERKRAEEELRETKQIIEEIINAIHARIFWKDRNLVFLGCNAEFARDAGFSDPKDLIGKDDYQMGWHDQAELYRSDDRQVIESGCSKLNMEELQTTPEGKTITLLTSKVPLLDSKGKVNGVIGTYIDITERKLAEEALQESEEKYRAIFENVLDVFYKIDLSGIIQEISPSIEHFTGFNRDELIGSSVYEHYFHGDDRVTFLNALMKNGEIMDYELLLKEKTGEIKHASINARLILDTDGRPNHIVGVIRDITERKKAEEALLESEEKFRSIAEQTTDLIALTDTSGLITYASSASRALFRYEPAEMCGHPFMEFLNEPSIPRAMAAFRDAIELGKIPKDLELEMKRKDGSLFFGELNGSLFRSGMLNGSLVIIHDITDRKQSEEKIYRQLEELRRWQEVTLGREDRNRQLKSEVNELLIRLGETIRYPSQEPNVIKDPTE